MSHDFSSQINSAPYSPASSLFSLQTMADPNVQQSRQQTVAYPSPHSYPSPSMQPTYTYPPPQGQQTTDAYRGSPQGSNMSLPPLNLPPIRLQDAQQPQAQPQHQHQHQPQPMGSPLPPPQHGMPQYYPHPAHAQPGQPIMTNMGPQFNAMRYQLPPQPDQRVLSGGRHKKEIKRRTKTGCLTCRKRRIKVSPKIYLLSMVRDGTTRTTRRARSEEELLPCRLLNRARNPNSSNPTSARPLLELPPPRQLLLAKIHPRKKKGQLVVPGQPPPGIVGGREALASLLQFFFPFSLGCFFPSWCTRANTKFSTCTWTNQRPDSATKPTPCAGTAKRASASVWAMIPSSSSSLGRLRSNPLPTLLPRLRRQTLPPHLPRRLQHTARARCPKATLLPLRPATPVPRLPRAASTSLPTSTPSIPHLPRQTRPCSQPSTTTPVTPWTLP